MPHKSVNRPAGVLSDAQAAYVEWHVDPNRGTKIAFAQAHGVHADTLYKWEHTEWFKHAVERRMIELNLNPTRLQDVIEAMYRAAKNGDVQAAKTYLAYVERLSPTKVVERRDKVEDLTDEELDAYLLG